MDAETSIRRAQLYGFLAQVFAYPTENWTEDLPAMAAVGCELDATPPPRLPFGMWRLSDLQADYRNTIGLTGTLCYETEYGLPHEFRQSQEMADIAGFYRAFGFQIGGAIAERPDHLGAQLEFMYVLALKEAHAQANGMDEPAQVCREAQRSFLGDHLARWIGLFAERVSQMANDGAYLALARFATAFVTNDAQRLGARIEQRQLLEVLPTPFDQDFSCAACSGAAESEGE